MPAELIIAVCTMCNTVCQNRKQMHASPPIEWLSIRRMQVLGAFPAVLDDLNFKFSWGEHAPQTP